MKAIETIIRIVFFSSSIVFSLYIWCIVFRSWAQFLPRGLGHAAIWWCREIRPLVLVAIPLDTLHFLAEDHHLIWKMLNTLVNMFYMWFAIFDKDDRWKKRRKKLAAKVKEIGGKLVVVPVVPVPVGAR